MKIMAKKTTLTQIAAQKSGKERYCTKCEFKSGKICPHMWVCDAAFRRGFVKGYDYHKKESKNNTKSK